MVDPGGRAIQLRLASRELSVRAGAGWEAWLRRWLEHVAENVAQHPSVPGLTRRPDLVASLGCERAYLEATATGGGQLRGHRQTTAPERLHDVLMSRLKQKSRAFQGIDAPLVLALLCVASSADRSLARSAVAEFFDPQNEAGRNASALLVGWNLDERLAPRELLWHEHPAARRPIPAWLRGAACQLQVTRPD